MTVIEVDGVEVQPYTIDTLEIDPGKNAVYDIRGTNAKIFFSSTIFHYCRCRRYDSLCLLNINFEKGHCRPTD
jgi:hypothetical protein